MCIKQVASDDIVADTPATSGGVKMCPEKIKIDDNGDGDVSFKEDILATSTRYTKIAFNGLNLLYIRFLESNYYKVLFGTTQPAHMIIAIAVTAIAFLCYCKDSHSETIDHSPFLTFIHLGTFSLHWGAQVWMTFVSGLSLYFNIPRHTFGSIQRVLFPRYFALNATLSFVTLATFLKINNTELLTPEVAFQAATLTTCFFVELIIRLYWTRPLVQLIGIKNRLEEAAGVGKEIGKIDPGSLMDCPYYLKIHNTFRKLHSIIAFGNITTMACSVLHLYYISQKICFL